MKKISNAVKSSNVTEHVFFLVLLFFAGTLAFGKGYSYAVTDGITLWAATLLPSLFPYFFITALLTSLSVTVKSANKLSPLTEKLFRTGGVTGYAFFISALSGYPVGAKTVADLKNRGLISEAEAVRASAFCSTPSPMFLIAGIGELTFNDKGLGICLFACCFFSAIITGMTFSLYKRKESPSVRTVYSGNTPVSFYEAVYSSVISVLVVGGVIVLFALIAEIMKDIGIFSPIERLIGLFSESDNIKSGIAEGLLECTGGLKTLAKDGIGFYTLPIAAALCGFGGISVIVQSTVHLKSAKIKIAPFLAAKAEEAVLCFIFGIILSFIFFK